LSADAGQRWEVRKHEGFQRVRDSSLTAAFGFTRDFRLSANPARAGGAENASDGVIAGGRCSSLWHIYLALFHPKGPAPKMKRAWTKKRKVGLRGNSLPPGTDAARSFIFYGAENRNDESCVPWKSWAITPCDFRRPDWAHRWTELGNFGPEHPYLNLFLCAQNTDP